MILETNFFCANLYHLHKSRVYIPVVRKISKSISSSSKEKMCKIPIFVLRNPLSTPLPLSESLGSVF